MRQYIIVETQRAGMFLPALRLSRELERSFLKQS